MVASMGVVAMDATEVVYHVINALDAAGVSYMLVGSFSSNLYGIARSTQDVDFVIELGTTTPNDIARSLGPDFQFEPQMSFETITGTYRFVASHRASAFKVEFFLLSDDAHDLKRFSRRRKEAMPGQQTYVASPEDVIVTKLRWSKGGNRKKDVDDVRNVIRVQENAIDWPYVEYWCGIHGTLDLLNRTRLEAASDGPG
jgi:hypothetical protein